MRCLYKIYFLISIIIIFLFSNCSVQKSNINSQNSEQKHVEITNSATNSSKLVLENKVNTSLTNTTISNQTTLLEYKEDNTYDLSINSDLNTPLVDDELYSWFGFYSFNEFIPPNVILDQKIKIYKENGEYYARITLDGFMTMERLKAKVQGDKEHIDLVLDSTFLPTSRYKKGDILVSFKRDCDNVYTYWGKMVPILPDNNKVGNIYFEKENNVLSIWINNYYFEEKDLNSNLKYRIVIEKLSENIEARLDITKGETVMTLNAKLEGDENDVSLCFEQYHDNNKFGDFKKGDILLTFKRQGSKVYTYWGKFKPQLHNNKESGKIYFMEK